MKAKAVGVGVLAWFAYGGVWALLDIFVGLPEQVRIVGSTVIVVLAVITAVGWYRKRTEPSGTTPPAQ